MPTIVLATQKGGAGKSTLAIGLALAAIQDGHRVRMIETDPLGTLSSWRSRRILAEPQVERLYNANRLEQRLQALDDDTITIIDTAGGMNVATAVAIRYADLCLIPARPSIADIEATASTLGAVRAWNKPFAFVLNQTPIRGQRIGNAAIELSADAAREMGDILARPFIAMRNDHQDALSAGLAVCEYAAHSKSAGEIDSLWEWIARRLNFGISLLDGIIDELVMPQDFVPAIETTLSDDALTMAP